MVQKQSKNQLRKSILDKRLILSKSLVDEKSQVICNNINSLLNSCSFTTIGFYFSIQNEVDLSFLVPQLLNNKRIIVYPKIEVDDDTIHFYSVNDLKKDFILGKYNILEPIAKQKTSPEQIDILLVPGIAFDIKGNRIGYGKGYYDRFLSVNRVLTIGIAYDFQVLDGEVDIPFEKQDRKMDMIVTETRVLEIKRTVHTLKKGEA